MEKLSPLGEVYQAGTFNGNPLSLTAGYATIQELEKGDIHKKVNALREKITAGLEDFSQRYGIGTRIYGIASMFQIYFTNNVVRDYSSALEADKDTFLRFQQGLLSRGVFFPPSQYECNFLSNAHDHEEAEATLGAAEEVMKGLK